MPNFPARLFTLSVLVCVTALPVATTFLSTSFIGLALGAHEWSIGGWRPFAPDALNPSQPAAPMRIVPEWYVLPYYAMLRAVTFSKFGGLIAAGLALLAPIALAFSSWERMGLWRWTGFTWSVALTLLGLSWLGAQLAEGWVLPASQVFTATYFSLFLIVFHILARLR